MPYPNFHAARILEPSEFREDTYANTTLENSKGIELVSAKLKANEGKDDDPMTAQSYRFPKDNYTAQQAKDWLKEHDIKYISFEEAKEETAEKTSATFKIYGLIGEPFSEEDNKKKKDNIDFITVKEISDFIDNSKDIDKLIIKINSCGGNVTDGYTIYDLLVNSGKEIETIVEGKCYSIATVIALAGSIRKMYKNSNYLIHNPFLPENSLTASYGADELTLVAQSLKDEENKLNNFYVEKTGKTIDILNEYLKTEKLINAETAKELGFITDIIEPLKAVAYINTNNINHKNNKIMENLVNEVKGMSKILTGIKAIFTKAEGTEPVALKQKLTDGSEIDIDKMEVGGKVTKDGEPIADGSYDLEDGTKITVVAGLITEITMPSSENIDVLKAEIETLKAQLAEKETVIEASKTENETLKTEFSEIKETVAFIQKNIQSNYTPPSKQTQFKDKDIKDKSDIEIWNEKRKAKKK